MRRFPYGLTLAVLVAFGILLGLGSWQLRRLAWKEDLLRRVEALQAAPARPAAEILDLARRGDDMEYRRIEADCLPPPKAASDAFRYALRDGRVGWRLLSACRLATGPYDGLIVDRGLVGVLAGAMAPTPVNLPPPGALVGVLRSAGAKPLLGAAETQGAGGARVFRLLDHAAVTSLAAQSGLARPAPYILAVESERPAATGLIPAALPQDIPNNHFVYALTWFALAAVLLWVYGALLLRRLRGR